MWSKFDFCSKWSKIQFLAKSSIFTIKPSFDDTSVNDSDHAGMPAENFLYIASRLLYIPNFLGIPAWSLCPLAGCHKTEIWLYKVILDENLKKTWKTLIFWNPYEKNVILLLFPILIKHVQNQSRKRSCIKPPTHSPQPANYSSFPHAL